MSNKGLNFKLRVQQAEHTAKTHAFLNLIIMLLLEIFILKDIFVKEGSALSSQRAKVNINYLIVI